ncbi:hypothetical protein EOL96_03075 [Candidatus Saccharibacteria bacterium]|nr:hypothetical protein [Candidatus Saccharibacteria bacterium]
MKKLKIPNLRRKRTGEAPGRITNETVAEHREKILAGGRKFKYPIQYARHKLVINALLVSFVSIALLAILGWYQLYVAQNSSTFMYRIARVVPFPVAVVDGEFVPYDDYLSRYRFNEFWLQKYGDIKLDSVDGKKQLQYIKRQVLDAAIENAYAKKLAPKYNVTVTDREVEDTILQQRHTASGQISAETYYSALLMTNGWTADDLKLSLRRTILRNKVAFAVDSQAKKQAEDAAKLVESTKGDFANVAKSLDDLPGGKIVVSDSGLVNIVSSFGGLQISDIAKLSKGELSGLIKSSTDDGYYFVKIIEKTDTQISFSYLHIPLTMFSSNVDTMKKNGKVQEYININ